MAYCEDKAIPHSQFLRDWQPRDRAKVLAFRLEKAARCQRCGTAEWEWEADPLAYEPATVACPGCAKLEADEDPRAQRPPGSQRLLIARAAMAKIRATPKASPRRRRE